jgi:hypothetical protein
MLKLVIKLGKIWFVVANTLDFYTVVLITIVKAFMVQADKASAFYTFNLVFFYGKASYTSSMTREGIICRGKHSGLLHHGIN